ncbi:uncharacterized protein LY89DRAFT_733668 [Mollisia scopiformis]|uniref:Uncharacterized protein n=1 Tax=Mollisia scopiformis TaxID=149040 RepID=A0A194X915_MOLSC|nr:uncharacterized protein LY89DRAFT_733668 [Mollisia scopiformis]KUJ16663.1 hypothetical protein LY89DRAFT_733668 [Mollisia scopiformis]
MRLNTASISLVLCFTFTVSAILALLFPELDFRAAVETLATRLAQEAEQQFGSGSLEDARAGGPLNIRGNKEGVDLYLGWEKFIHT